MTRPSSPLPSAEPLSQEQVEFDSWLADNLAQFVPEADSLASLKAYLRWTPRHAVIALAYAATRYRAGMEAAAKDRYAQFLSWRGIEKPCKQCGGAGSLVYGDTAMGRGIGGQTMTRGRCNKCWGSGDAEQLWKEPTR